jgi:hypothetical protein
MTRDWRATVLNALKPAQRTLARIPLCAVLVSPLLEVDLRLEMAAAKKAQPATAVPAPRPASAEAPLDLLLRQYREAVRGSDHRRVLAIAHAVSELPGGPKAEALYEMARRYSLLAERDESFSCLARAVEAGFADAKRLVADPAFKAVRGEQPFAALAARAARGSAAFRSSRPTAAPRRRPSA